MTPLLTILAVAAIVSSCVPNEQPDERKRSETSPTQHNGTQNAESHTDAIVDVISLAGPRPPLKNVALNLCPAGEPAADWRTALSDPTVSAAVKEATVKKLGEEKNVEAVPLLLENLLKIRPAYRASADNWTPCRTALIQIGEPAVIAVSERFLVADTFAERHELFTVLRCIGGGDWALEWLDVVRDVTPLLGNEEFTTYWKIAEDVAANDERRLKDWLKLHPEASATP